MSTSTTGTGTITLGSALTGFQTFDGAGVTNGQTVRYVIEDGGNFEIGSGAYTTSGTTLARGATESSNSDSAINLSGSATVFIAAVAADIFTNDGSRSLTTTGVITGGTVEATSDTAAGDNAAIGYTAAEGLILTGQGSTNDVTIKNDADADVLEIPTGTTNVNVAGNLGVGGTVDGRDVATDGSKLDGIESGATADQTAEQLLTAIKTVDGAGSGLDADTLDGLSEATFMRRSANSELDMNNNDIVGVDQIIHDGDTDTYIQFHAADQFRVVTGGTERFEVNNTNITMAATLQMSGHQIDMNNNDIIGVDQIFHEGDSNTYIQFHASDQFRVVTGGAERLEVNNSRTQIDNLLVTGTTTLSGTVTGAVSTTTGGVGTYAWLGGSSTSIRPNAGNSISGSSLRYAGTASTATYSDNTAARIGFSSPSTPSGTWRAMGGTGNVARYNATLYIRIS